MGISGLSTIGSHPMSKEAHAEDVTVLALKAEKPSLLHLNSFTSPWLTVESVTAFRWLVNFMFLLGHSCQHPS